MAALRTLLNLSNNNQTSAAVADAPAQPKVTYTSLSTELKSNSMDSAHETFKKAYEEFKTNQHRALKLDHLRKALTKMEELHKQGHALPKDFNLGEAKSYITIANEDIIFLHNNGRSWKYYLKPLQQAAAHLASPELTQKDSVITELKTAIQRALQFCEIKKRRNLFKKPDSYKNHLIQLAEYKTILGKADPKALQEIAAAEAGAGHGPETGPAVSAGAAGGLWQFVPTMPSIPLPSFSNFWSTKILK